MGARVSCRAHGCRRYVDIVVGFGRLGVYILVPVWAIDTERFTDRGGYALSGFVSQVLYMRFCGVCVGGQAQRDEGR